MDAAEHVFRTFLKEKRLKYTTERVAVLKSIQSFGRPFEAEELLLKLSESEQRVSKATIYRALKHLVEARLVKQVFFGSGKQSHYDFVGGADRHDHLLDLETGQIVPFSNDEVIKLRDRIAQKMGFTAVNHRFQIIARRAGEQPAE